MNKLKVLDLTGCRKIRRTPDFSNFLTLDTLILAQCVKLTANDSSIGELKRLRILNLEGCRSLEELPEEVRSLANACYHGPTSNRKGEQVDKVSGGYESKAFGRRQLL